jgi:hypothetical protein
MKPLLTLFLLFVCLMASGQDDMYPHNNWEVIEFIDDYGSTKVVDSMTIITFEMLLDYAEECYNDSTFDWTVHYMRPYISVRDTSITFIPHYKYTHRTPTFEGFIEYLKRNLKK